MHLRDSRGFTLAELLITVGVASILASLAASSFFEMQLRTKRAELPVNLSGIHAAEVAYQHEFGHYLLAPVQPRSDGQLDGRQFDWPATADGFMHIGWAPDGPVYGNYQVEAVSDEPLGFRAVAHSDLDNDNILAEYEVRDIREPLLATVDLY